VLSTYQPVCMLILQGVTNQAVRIWLRFFVGIYRRIHVLVDSSVNSAAPTLGTKFSNHVRLLTALVRSSPISRRPWSMLKPMRPMVIRMLLQMSCACGESSIFED
jgi:hypothetical protein